MAYSARYYDPREMRKIRLFEKSLTMDDNMKIVIKRPGEDTMADPKAITYYNRPMMSLHKR